MSDESGRYTAEHTVMGKDLEIRELKHLLEVKDNKIKELESQIVQLKSPDYPKSEEGLTVHFDNGQSYDNRVKMSGDNPTGELDESEDEFTEQLSFTYNQE
jgi:stress response protein SCP2